MKASGEQLDVHPIGTLTVMFRQVDEAGASVYECEYIGVWTTVEPDGYYVLKLDGSEAYFPAVNVLAINLKRLNADNQQPAAENEQI